VARAGSLDALISGDSAAVVLGIEMGSEASSKRRKVYDFDPSDSTSAVAGRSTATPGTTTTTTTATAAAAASASARPPSPPGDESWKDSIGVSSCVDIFDPTLQIWQVGFVEYFGATPKDIFVSLQDGECA
jgi:hypothetical protein